jgi:peptidoglycan/LPS O-acetylase OafA/YrhL
VGGELPGFDGLRGLGATGVLVIHASIFTVWNSAPFLRDLIAQLRVAVEVFFMMSGFLLYRPFVSARLDGKPRFGWRTYAVHRAARLYPAYWAALIVTVVVLGQGGLDTVWLWVSHLLLIGVAEEQTRLAGLPVAWTLFVELGFYVFLPFFVVFVERGLRRVRPVRAELLAIGGMAVAGWIFQVWWAQQHGYLGWVSFTFYLPVFAIGMAAAVMHEVTRRRPEPHPLYTWIGSHSGLAWVAAGIVLVATAVRVNPVHNFALKESLTLETVLTVSAALLCVPAFFRAPEGRPGGIRRFLTSPVIAYLGVVSYGMYLWHYSILHLVRADWFGWPELGGNALALIPITFVLSVAVASASWYFLERPILRLVKPHDRRSAGSARRG